MPRRYALRKTQIVHSRSPHRRRKRWVGARWESRVIQLMQGARQPEVRLWAAVMWEVLRDLAGPLDDPNWQRAYAWLTAPPETPEPMGGFTWLCEELDLDPTWVKCDLLSRAELRRAAAA